MNVSKKVELSTDRVVINVSGMRFETKLLTLDYFPNTLLGDPNKRQDYFDNINNEYYFERHRQAFESILFYYQSKGRFLIRPLNVSSEIFFDEIIFFELGEEAIDKYKKDEGYLMEKQPKVSDLPTNKTFRSIWLLFEYPESSIYARIIAIISVIIIWISIALLCIETLPDVKSRTKASNASFSDEYFVIETICTLWFTVELFMRFLSSPSKLEFVKATGNIVDLISILPYLLQITDTSSKFGVLRILRVVRVFRIFKLARHFKGLQILAKTFQSSANELALLGLFLLIGVILFSSCVYFIEVDSEKTDFQSIPDAFWYSLITMTTVGYGDMVPKTPLGKVLGCVCAITGVLTLALPVPIIVSNFNFFYCSNKNLKKISKESLKASLGPEGSDFLFFEKQTITNPFKGCFRRRKKHTPVAL